MIHPTTRNDGTRTHNGLDGRSTLDELRRPAFRYEFAGVSVEDTLVPKVADVDVTLVRTLRFTGTKPSETWWFRAAVGDIKEVDGGFLVDEKVRFRFPKAQALKVGKELRVPLNIPGELVEEITW